MGRLPRIHYSGAVYHVMARGVDGRDIFIDDQDRRLFLNTLNSCVGDASAVVLAYCLMGNHFHLAIQVGDVPLATIIQRLLTGYAMTFNRRYARTGHLFQARYKAIMCLNERYLAILIHYIHMNPVRAGITARPHDWPWSSFSQKEIRVTTELDLIGFNPWPKAVDAVCELIRNDTAPRREISDIGADVSLRTGVSIESLRSGNRRRFVIDAKRQLTREAVQNGHALCAIAEWLRVAPSTMTRYFWSSNE